MFIGIPLIQILFFGQEEDVSKLELEYEIQKKIVSAALKLANDITTKKSVHKQRKLNYQQALTKLQLIEQRLRSVKQTTSHKSVGRNHIKRKQPRPHMTSSGKCQNDIYLA